MKRRYGNRAWSPEIWSSEATFIKLLVVLIGCYCLGLGLGCLLTSHPLVPLQEALLGFTTQLFPYHSHDALCHLVSGALSWRFKSERVSV